MKKLLSIISVILLCLAVFVGCASETEEPKEAKTTKKSEEVKKSEEKQSAGKEQSAENESVAKKEKADTNTINALPAAIDMDNLDNCSPAVSLEKGNAYVDNTGKMVMKVKVYTYDLYDMVDIAALKEGDEIVRQGETVTVSELERLETGLIRINGGEENGGFDLASNDNTVYYEIGMNDIKAYYELGEVTLPVSTEFVYTDSSDLDAGEVVYYPGDLLTDIAGIEYNFNPNNTTIVIEDGVITAMNKVYMP